MTAMKCGASFPRAIFHRQILLVVAHHGDQHFLRQLQIGRVETAEDRGRELGDVGEGMEQIGVGLKSFAIQQSGDLGFDFAFALIGGKDDAVGAELLVEVGDGDQDGRLAKYTMAYGRYCRMRRRQSRTARRHRQAEPRSQRIGRMNRSEPFPFQYIVLGHVNLKNQIGQLRGPESRCRLALGSFGKTEVLALCRGFGAQFVGCRTHLLGETGGALRHRRTWAVPGSAPRYRAGARSSLRHGGPGGGGWRRLT